MCGRFTNTASPEEIDERIGRPLGVRVRESAGTGRYNVAPTEQVITILAPREAQPEARLLRWGLLPGHQTRTRYPLINARLETLLEDGRYAGVPADRGQPRREQRPQPRGPRVAGGSRLSACADGGLPRTSPALRTKGQKAGQREGQNMVLCSESIGNTWSSG